MCILSWCYLYKVQIKSLAEYPQGLVIYDNEGLGNPPAKEKKTIFYL